MKISRLDCTAEVVAFLFFQMEHELEDEEVMSGFARAVFVVHQLLVQNLKEIYYTSQRGLEFGFRACRKTKKVLDFQR